MLHEMKIESNDGFGIWKEVYDFLNDEVFTKEQVQWQWNDDGGISIRGMTGQTYTMVESYLNCRDEIIEEDCEEMEEYTSYSEMYE